MVNALYNVVLLTEPSFVSLELLSLMVHGSLETNASRLRSRLRISEPIDTVFVYTGGVTGHLRIVAQPWH